MEKLTPEDFKSFQDFENAFYKSLYSRRDVLNKVFDRASPALQRRLCAKVGVSDKAYNKYRNSGLKNLAPTADNDVWVQGFISGNDSWFFDEELDTTPENFQERLDKIKGDVLVSINSPGGSVDAAYTIAALLNDRRAKGDKVSIRVMGLAASAAAVLALEDPELKISDPSVMMFHKVLSVVFGNADDFTKEIKSLKGMDADILAKMVKAGMPENEAKQAMEDERLLTVTELMEYGVAKGKVEYMGEDDDDEEAEKDGDEKSKDMPDDDDENADDEEGDDKGDDDDDGDKDGEDDADDEADEKSKEPESPNDEKDKSGKDKDKDDEDEEMENLKQITEILTVL